jgi:hypothetical protein
MSRPPAITPNSVLNVAIPAHLRKRLDEFLWSEVEGRVPKGAYMAFLSERLREYFTHYPLDLAPFLGSVPGEHMVYGPLSTIAALQQLLKGSNENDNGSMADAP